MIEGVLDARHRVGDMMETLPVSLEEPADRALWSQWLEELDERTSDRDHGLLDSLVRDDLPIERSDPVTIQVAGDGSVEILHRDRHMVEIDEFHQAEAIAPGGVCHAIAGTIEGRRSHLQRSVITGIARTPIGRYNGGLAPLRAVDLGGAAIAAAVDRAGADPSAIDEVMFGHVLQAGEGQITARQAAVSGGLPMTVPSVTINKVCLSGMSAIGLADRSIRLGESKFVIAGGMESMSNAPYLIRDLRWGARIGNTEAVDVMQHDGLFCTFDQCTMGEQSDHKNERLGISRHEQDEWSARSHERAAAARDGAFQREIVPVEVPQRRGEPTTIATDEGIRESSTVESLGALDPAFVSTGTITAGNASQISDGAAAVMVADREAAWTSGAPVLAEILAYGQIGGIDATLHERPAEALLVALKNAGLSPGDLDLVEINEAFAAVSLWSARMLDLDGEKVNVHGGAVALGHPLGATGARLVVSLVNALVERGGGIGGATLCGGGGQGDAIIVKVGD